MQAIAYATLKQHALLGKVHREFRNSLLAAYEQNLEKNRSYFKCVQYVSDILSTCALPCAMLKGAVLCRYYPEGYRTSNDIDLLVLPEHVTEIGRLLIEAGFQQGNVRNGEFIPATRKEIIESKMMRGETVPYIKQVNLPQMKYLEVDINFSLDYKNANGQELQQMLGRACVKNCQGMQIPTLSDVDFFIHLCGHLHKEATTMPWVEMMRDMTLYKYCDVYMLLNDMSIEEIDHIFERAHELGLGDICAFAIMQTAELFDMEKTYAIQFSEQVLADCPNFLHTVISPKDKQSFVYTKANVKDRFFADNRVCLLKKEV